MIIARSPLRISLGGGGTDVPSYYRIHSGFLIAATIDKYVYIMLHKTFVPETIIKYSKMERVRSVDDIEHPIIRESFRMMGLDCQFMELASMADIPAGTGLGSSGSFTTALLRVLHAHSKNLIHPQQLAEEACKIEIDILKEPIGKQDQYASALGGVTCYQFLPDDRVVVSPLKISTETLYTLEDNLLLFFTGYQRQASDILRDQDTRTKKNDPDMINNLHLIKNLGYESKEALETGNLERFAEIMNIHWEHKRKRTSTMSNDHIDKVYQHAKDNGAMSGKMIGAGGGGFLLFYAHDRVRLRKAMAETGLEEVRFRFDFEGTKLLNVA